MSVVDLRDRAVPGPAPAHVRDLLASDVDGRLIVHAPAAPPRRRRAELTTWPVLRSRHRLPVGWPIAAAIALLPVWWVLGVADLAFPCFGLVLAWQLRRRQVVLPSGFWIWGLFLALVLVSGLAIDAQLTGASTSEGAGRYLAWVLRLCHYLTVTVMLLFVTSTTEEELPRLRLIRWMGSLAVSCILLGAVSLLLPDFSFVSPASYVLPGALSDEGGAVVKLAQFQPVLGDAAPRPSAPFAFTNAWGNALSLLLVWLAVGWGVAGSSRRRAVLWLLLALAVVPTVFSLNRAMWLGLAVSVIVVTVRLALLGRVKALGGLVLLATLVFGGLAASPLEAVVQSRMEAGHSDSVRSSLMAAAVDAAQESPLIGFGSTRKTLGSDASIAVGPSESCPKCGARNIGSTGQLPLLLVSQGFLGALLYIGFLGWTIFRFARDHSPIGIAATLVVGLTILYSGFYAALTVPLAVTFVSIGLLWRNDRLRRGVEAT